MTLTDTDAGREPDGRVRTVTDLSRRHGLELLRFAYLICGDRVRAEDLLQEVLLALYRRFGDALPVDNPVGYARRSVVNTNISWARRAADGERAVDTLPERPVLAVGHDPAAVDLAERDALWQALRRLPVRQRTVLVLRFYNDATDEQIAELLECRRGTVRSLASRGLDALRSDTTLRTDGGSR